MIIISYDLLGVKEFDSTDALEKLKPVFGASSPFNRSPTAVLVSQRFVRTSKRSLDNRDTLLLFWWPI